jgi:hypothetical protein
LVRREPGALNPQKIPPRSTELKARRNCLLDTVTPEIASESSIVDQGGLSECRAHRIGNRSDRLRFPPDAVLDARRSLAGSFRSSHGGRPHAGLTGRLDLRDAAC